jgi:hypothetical protein
MKREYDFSKAVKGKFFRKGATLRLPIYLGTKLQNQLERIARKKGKDLEDIVNELVKEDVALLEEFT